MIFIALQSNALIVYLNMLRLFAVEIILHTLGWLTWHLMIKAVAWISHQTSILLIILSHLTT